MTKRPLTELDVTGKRVLVRVDFNVPLDGTKITDDTRIRAALPTIEWLIDRNAKIVLCSHLGRPKGKIVEKLRLKPVGAHLAHLLDRDVKIVNQITGDRADSVIDNLEESEVALLENLRFDPREEENDPEFAKALAAPVELYVNDAFGAAHRAHASTEGVAHLLPSAVGLLMQKELNALGALLDAPKRPFVAIIGGAKVSDKIAVLQHLLERIDILLIGGGMANTFLKATGHEVGKSLLEQDHVATASEILGAAAARGIRVMLPTDIVIAQSIDDERGSVVSVDDIPADRAIFDIGPRTASAFATAIVDAATILWNGPLGVAEKAPFAAGTNTIAKAVTEADGFTVVGGGDSVAAIQALGLTDRIDHVSTGGGASLEFLEGNILPGLAAIPDA